jgi:hypothetical protein
MRPSGVPDGIYGLAGNPKIAARLKTTDGPPRLEKLWCVSWGDSWSFSSRPRLFIVSKTAQVLGLLCRVNITFRIRDMESEKTEDPAAFLEEVRKERDALAKRILESQEVIARSQRLLKRLDAILDRKP